MAATRPARAPARARCPPPTCDAAIALQRRHGLPAALEWIPASAARAWSAAARQAGLVVDELPLLVALDTDRAALPSGVRLYLSAPTTPSWPATSGWPNWPSRCHPGALVDAEPGTSSTGVAPDRLVDARPAHPVLRDRIAAGAP